MTALGEAVEHFSYDKVGNRLTNDKTSTTWNYNKNNELQSFDNTSFKYNLNGQLTEKTVDGTKTYYSYNLDGRLKEIKDNSNQVIAQYEYDPFGRRTSKALPQDSKVIYFHYSDEGVVGEYAESGNVIQSYGYKPDSDFTTNPVFTQRPDFISKSKGGFVYYINDHLDTPQKLITETGRKVWEASLDAFGNTIIINSEFRNPLRFPGQYNDVESDMNNNYHRYYDFNLGRYISSDPIGLKGGLNTYAYADSSPIISFDELGLVRTKIKNQNLVRCRDNERKQCRGQCKNRGGVKTCMVTKGTRKTIKNGTPATQIYIVPGSMNCVCNDDDNEPPCPDQKPTVVPPPLPSKSGSGSGGPRVGGGCIRPPGRGRSFGCPVF